jgi:hypothetical protein
MFEKATTRALPLVNRVADLTPDATGCCNACRTCLTANAVGFLGVVLLPLARFARRIIGAS